MSVAPEATTGGLCFCCSLMPSVLNQSKASSPCPKWSVSRRNRATPSKYQARTATLRAMLGVTDAKSSGSAMDTRCARCRRC